MAANQSKWKIEFSEEELDVLVEVVIYARNRFIKLIKASAEDSDDGLARRISYHLCNRILESIENVVG